MWVDRDSRSVPVGCAVLWQQGMCYTKTWLTLHYRLSSLSLCEWWENDQNFERGHKTLAASSSNFHLGFLIGLEDVKRNCWFWVCCWNSFISMGMNPWSLITCIIIRVFFPGSLLLKSCVPLWVSVSDWSTQKQWSKFSTPLLILLESLQLVSMLTLRMFSHPQLSRSIQN